ncbi:MAG: 6-phosphofructokinase [Deltaproteobacteria bacterium CG_4_10_14_0_2_um_filter_43_8]|nr:MAG: 6-phosphofructokinase [Deltaproteobacteria bacterium CG11_big_fil_rev_8_21_14_0_20_42_23]PJA21103.1 MAG: 6-phosphofructokinase [Deltaproteobacteria bacterium CG_4_10_14_0_2_um_filter_43_8]PJC63386.1 MAG: 6-phosphofructokinase [Deltaproteobacteria bacterium CG_4_9_14_0_2_um_filter_42_21]
MFGLSSKKRVGILTGGGDCPGLNAVIRAVVRRALHHDGYEIVGIRNGWKGLVEKDVFTLDREAVRGILVKGGTLLGTSRTNIYKTDELYKKAISNLKSLHLEGLVAIGGEDTLGVAAKLSAEGYNVVGVPKTIDNDLLGTDYTFGFDTAVEIATQAIDRLHTTAESHHRVLVVEVMGRHAGWIAMHSGLAGGADVILIPEKPIDLAEVCDLLNERHKKGVHFSIVVVAEGAKIKEEDGQREVLSSEKRDEFGHVQLGGIGEVLSKSIQKCTGYDTRVTVLGHVQRGGTPTSHDRVLATKFGVAAMDAIHSKHFGVMVALQGKDIVEVPLSTVASGIKTVDDELYEMSKTFWGY